MGAYFEDRGLVWTVKATSAPKPADVAEHVERLAELQVVQIEQGARAGVDRALVRVLRERVFEARPDITLRIYLGETLDLSFLEDLPMLQRLVVEAASGLKNVASLEKLGDLRSVDLTLPRVVPRDLLGHLPRTLESLSVRPDDRAKHDDIDLVPLATFTQLRSLALEGYARDVLVLLPRLKRLRRLTLRSIKTMIDLQPLAGLSDLRSLTLQGGAFTALDPLLDVKKLGYLQLWNLPKLVSIAPIAGMAALEGLFFETLSTVAAFPETAKLARLRLVKLASMKNLRDFTTLERAPALEELVFQKADHQRPDDFLPVLRNKRLKRAGFGFHKKADVRRMTELCAEHGVDGEVYMFPQLRGELSPQLVDASSIAP